MQIKKMGVEITDVPGIEWIKIEPDGLSDSGVHALIKFNDLPALDFGINELGLLIAGLVKAEGEARLMASRPPDRWDRLEDIPEYVVRVWDRDSDRWDREGDRWVTADGDYNGPASGRYGPFRATK